MCLLKELRIQSNKVPGYQFSASMKGSVMRFLSAFICFVVLLSPAVCHADFYREADGGGGGSVTPMTFKELTDVFSTIEADVLPVSVQEFGFSPDGPPSLDSTPDGLLVSAVLSNGDGLYAYLYQVQNSGPFVDDEVSRMIIAWPDVPFEEASIDRDVEPSPLEDVVFEIFSKGGTTLLEGLAGSFDFGDVSGSIQALSDTQGESGDSLEVEWTGSNGAEVEPGESSAIIVVFSTELPTLTTPELDDGINDYSLKAQVYVPTPEPLQIVHLISAGLALGLGLFFFRSRRRLAS